MKEKRIGMFIGRQHLAFTQSEIDEVVENIKSQFIGNEFGFKYLGYEVNNECGISSLRINMSTPHYMGRDCEGARFDFKGIHFIFYKKKGELELNWEKKIYEPFEGFCYSGNIFIEGEWCRYRGRTWVSYQKECPYAYGDEISDLNYKVVLRQLYKDLVNCKQVA